MPDAVAYMIYPSIIRALTYSELEAYEAYATLSKIYDCPCNSEISVTLAYSECEAYSEPCQISTMELFCENS